MASRDRLAAALGGMLVGVVLLAGCSLVPQPVVTRLPPPAPAGTGQQGTPSPPPSLSPEPTSDPAGTAAPPDSGEGVVTSCGEGGTASVTGSERSVRVEGTCAQLTVSGTAVTVDAGSATIGTLVMSGDRIRVSTSAVDSATIQGNDTALMVAGWLGRLDLSGDRATVAAGGAIASVIVRGQDSTVTAGGGIGDSAVEGRGNTIG